MRLRHVPVARVAMRQRVLEIVGEYPHLAVFDELNCRCRNDLVVVHELRHRVFDVTHARFEDHVALANTFRRRHVFDQDHDAAADRAVQ